MARIEKVLILDETESNVLFFEMLFQQMDRSFKIFTAVTGAHGELLVKEERIQLVICAWEMQTMPGTVFVQRIRNNKAKRHIPCLIFSKRMGPEDITLTKELGYEDILGMPFDKEEATRLIMQLISNEETLSSEEKKLRKIESLIHEGGVTEALKLFDTALTRKEQYRSRAKSNLAEIWVETRHFEKAEKILDEVLAEDPDYLHALRLKARLCSRMGRHEEAISILEMVTQKSPQNIRSMLCLGSAYVDASQHDKAREVFGRVKGLDAENTDLRDEEGKLAFKEGDIPLAARLLAETEYGDELARHFNNIAISKVSTGEFEEAIQTYHNAIQLLTDKARLHQLQYNLGLAWKKKGDLHRCFQALCESYLGAPDFEKAYVAIARTAREIKSQGGRPDQDLVAQVQSCRKSSREGQKS
ncbi:MAG: tetratricopeptide repeat protein [Deltaproteobacteria bacterium]|nr:tetratricopeptide repeat protein [Deltaproteobacteria bacterium]